MPGSLPPRTERTRGPAAVAYLALWGSESQRVFVLWIEGAPRRAISFVPSQIKSWGGVRRAVPSHAFCKQRKGGCQETMALDITALLLCVTLLGRSAFAADKLSIMSSEKAWKR